MWRQTEFYETPIMPTYMISLIISDFKCINQTTNSKFSTKLTVGICGVSTSELSLALNISKHSVEFLENYVQSSFYLPKIGRSN